MIMSGFNIPTISASKISPPPEWALLQRKLFSLLEEAGDLSTKKYARPDGRVYHFFDVDDAYESRSMRGIFYALGGADRFLDIAKREYNSITWMYSEERHLPGEDTPHPMWMPQLRNEYWNLDVPFNADWFHMGEGNQMFYDFGISDPADPTNRERARKFANMYIGEDEGAPNWDPVHKIIRSPFHGGAGPMTTVRSHKGIMHTDGKISNYIHLVRHWLDRGSLGDFGHRNKLQDIPSKGPIEATFLYPRVKELESRWYEDEQRCTEIIDLFDEMVLQGDEPSNLCTAALVTNAYLYTGEDKYKRWVLEYVQGWIDRIYSNNGIIPDNVGPTGKIGEFRNNQWWGGIHGWSSSERAIDRLFLGLIIGSECAHLLSGDDSYLDLLRSQITMLLDNSKLGANGQLQVPTSFGPDGWSNYGSFSVRGGIPHLAHLWHATLSQSDSDIIARVRDGDKSWDWNDVPIAGDRGGGATEAARYQYYVGNNPDWPLNALKADYSSVARMHESQMWDQRSVEQIIRDNNWPPNPMVVKALVQTTMGCPQTLYNGGILRATVRYFDVDRVRPGLPSDVAALVDELSPETVGIQLVNTSSSEKRSLIVQAGAYGEHKFTKVSYINEPLDYVGASPGLRNRAEPNASRESIDVEDKYFAVDLPPMTSIRVQCGLRRFVNDPSYAFPWHRGRVPVQ